MFTSVYCFQYKSSPSLSPLVPPGKSELDKGIFELARFQVVKALETEDLNKINAALKNAHDKGIRENQPDIAKATIWASLHVCII